MREFGAHMNCIEFRARSVRQLTSKFVHWISFFTCAETHSAATRALEATHALPLPWRCVFIVIIVIIIIIIVIIIVVIAMGQAGRNQCVA